MKTIIKYFLIITLLPVFISGCNQEDDIYEIFTSDTWHWSMTYSTTNWKDDNNAKPHINIPPDKQYEINKDRNVYIITFDEDGTFQAKGNSISFSGRWTAEPNEHTVSITNVNLEGNPLGLDKMFYDGIKNAQFYRGSSLLLKLFNSAKNEFMQFYPQSKK